MVKICSKCKQELPLSMFHAKRESPDGLRYDCKFCKKASDKGRHLRKTNPRDRSDRDRRGDLKGRIHAMLNRAIKKGTIRKQFCEICGKYHRMEMSAHAHHNDYRKPLEVVWLCPKHHLAWHRVFVAEHP